MCRVLSALEMGAAIIEDDGERIFMIFPPYTDSCIVCMGYNEVKFSFDLIFGIFPNTKELISYLKIKNRAFEKNIDPAISQDMLTQQLLPYNFDITINTLRQIKNELIPAKDSQTVYLLLKIILQNDFHKKTPVIHQEVLETWKKFFIASVHDLNKLILQAKAVFG